MEGKAEEMRSAADDDGKDDLETMYVVVQLPKGTRFSANIYYDQLDGLDSSTPVLRMGHKTFNGRVETPLGTHYVLQKKRKPDDTEDIEFHSRVKKLIVFE
ncbi:hypothetical protein CTAYLR_004150 [Chrysophaeum taylorii]|uniref:Transcription factor TFIIIC triple barrel domain-containing protein n=1 Tax=Chrysophaeum taylorii TaxID=2483200 RepID=A0AAD7XQK4_9STRA|nr:hypothetical protein CTAYLR_004150 [Chrysophaeum taylorii]